MATLVHLGDFHAAPGPRNEARYRALDQVITEALQLPTLGAWLWPGDLSHARQSIGDENALIDRLRRMSAAAPVVIVYGNHDLDGDLDKFESVANGYPIYVIARPQVLRIRLATMQFASIACLNYPHKHGLVMAGCPNPDLVDVAADHLDAIFMQFAVELEQAREHGDYLAFIGHANIGGAITSSGQPNIAREIELSPRHLDRLFAAGVGYVGLNHIHRAQEIHGAYYAGSICRLDWGEIEEKRWLEVQLLDDSTHVVSHPIDVAPMYHVEAHLDRDGFSWACTAGPGGELQEPPRVVCVVCNGVGYVSDDGRDSRPCTVCCDTPGEMVSWRGCEVRVRVRYDASESPVLDRQRIAVQFADAAILHIDPIAEKKHALRAPEVAAAKTLPEKVAAWCSIGGTVASEGVVFKLGLLEQHDSSYVIECAADQASEIASGSYDDDKKATVAA